MIPQLNLDADARQKGSPMHLDVSETAFFKRQLESIKARTYDTKYRNLKAMEFIPVSTEHPSGTQYIIWYSFSKVGMAKIISDYAHDFPRVDVFAEENQARVKSLGAAYGYSIMEVRRAAMAGVPLNTRRADTARRSIEELMDRLAWYGDSDYNIQGFFDYPGTTEYTTPNGAGGNPEWSTKTPDEIIADLVGLMDAVSVPTNGREMVDTILLPRAQYNLIKNTRMGGSSDTTIFMYFMNNNPDVTIEALDELAGQGAGSSDRMYGYVRDPEHLVQEVVTPFEQLEEDKKGATWEVPVHAEFGGVTIFYPQSVAYADNI
jgi:hypothetical protein